MKCKWVDNYFEDTPSYEMSAVTSLVKSAHGPRACDIMIYWSAARRFLRWAFSKLIFQHWRQSSLFSLTQFQKLLLTKDAKVKNLKCCLKRTPGEANLFHSLPWPSLEAGLTFQRFILYLHMVGSCCFSCRRCILSADLRKDHPAASISKHSF